MLFISRFVISIQQPHESFHSNSRRPLFLNQSRFIARHWLSSKENWFEPATVDNGSYCYIGENTSFHKVQQLSEPSDRKWCHLEPVMMVVTVDGRVCRSGFVEEEFAACMDEQSLRGTEETSTDWLFPGMDVGFCFLCWEESILLPSWRRLMCLITAVALNACRHFALAKFFFICRLTDSWMFLQSAVSPAIHGCRRASSQVNLFSGSFCIRLPMKSLAESEISSQYGESNSYSALSICSNSLESFSS